MAMVILILGKTGHGKSSTGNTLLGTESFANFPTPCSLTRWTDRCSTVYNGINLSVIDTPGIFETNFNERPDNTDDIKYQCQIMDNLMNSLVLSGVNAFFFVYNITSKYTDEEAHAINILKQMFGTEAITKWGVLVFTYGDIFKTMNFEDWLALQTGKLGDLINMFNGRVLLISNDSDKKDLRSESRKEMIALVQRNLENGCYTLKDYEEHKNDRKLLIFHEKVEGIQAKYQERITVLTKSINKKKSLTDEENKKYIKKIEKLQSKVKTKSMGTDKLDVELQQLDQLRIIVDSKKDNCVVS